MELRFKVGVYTVLTVGGGEVVESGIDWYRCDSAIQADLMVVFLLV